MYSGSLCVRAHVRCYRNGNARPWVALCVTERAIAPNIYGLRWQVPSSWEVSCPVQAIDQNAPSYLGVTE